MSVATSRTGLAAWVNGQRVGLWDQRRGGASTFTYDAAWSKSAHARPLSLSLPLLPAGGVHRGAHVDAYFENLLPDSQAIRRRIHERMGARSTAAFDLLAEIGRDCVGAVQLLPVDEVPEGLERIDATSLSDAEVAQVLRSVPAPPGPGRSTAADFRISIAGAQEKTALLWHAGRWCKPHGATPTTHIFKLPLGRVGNMQADLATSVENEWLCSRLVSAFGLPIASTAMAMFEDQKALIVERFDRRRSSEGNWWLRLPQEDLCQAFGLPPTKKYEADGGPGVVQIMELLLRSANAEDDRRMFFTTQLVFWLLAAIDGHAKNFSLHVHAGGAYQLTPLYDVLSAYPILGRGPNRLDPHDAKLAMAVVSKNRHYRLGDILSRHWLAMAARCGVDGKALVTGVLERSAGAVRAVAESLPATFPDAVASPILRGVEAASERLASQLAALPDAR